jgi:hypothetical protein
MSQISIFLILVGFLLTIAIYSRARSPEKTHQRKLSKSKQLLPEIPKAFDVDWFRREALGLVCQWCVKGKRAKDYPEDVDTWLKALAELLLPQTSSLEKFSDEELFIIAWVCSLDQYPWWIASPGDCTDRQREAHQRLVKEVHDRSKGNEELRSSWCQKKVLSRFAAGYVFGGFSLWCHQLSEAEFAELSSASRESEVVA